jgi:HEAT repeat protein
MIKTSSDWFMSLDPSRIDRLLAQCRSSDPDQQMAAIKALEEAHVLVALPSIATLASSRDVNVRIAAIDALEQLGEHDPVSAGQALLTALSDTEWLVRAEAVDALGALAYTPAREALQDILHHDPEWVVRASAAEALGNLGAVEVVAALERTLVQDPEDVVRGYAALALGWVGTPQMVPELRNHLAAEQARRVRENLAAATYRLGARDDLAVLLDLLTSADDEEAVRMLNVIEDLTERKMPPSLAQDAPSIRQALQALIQRYPFFHNQASRIMERLAAFESG